MHDGILSQEEIDALLKGETMAQEPQAPVEEISAVEKDVLGEIGNISMGTSATTLSTLLRHRVSITTPRVRVITRTQLQDEYPLPYLLIEVKYTQGLSGSNILVIKKEDAFVIADLMMGGDGSNVDGDLDEIRMSAVNEAMNQMMGSSTTSLSSMFDRRIDIAPPIMTVVDFSTEQLYSTLGSKFERMVQTLFKMEIDGLVDSEIMQIMPIDAAKSMVATLMRKVPEAEESFTTAPEPEMGPPQMGVPPSSFVNPERIPNPPPVAPSQLTLEQQANPSDSYSFTSEVNKNQIAVQPVQFAPLTPETGFMESQNISLIMDVPLDIAVELGRTRKSIKEILELGPGSIIQLEKMAGEPVDLLVNGKLIAKGEVVVIDENYGIRVTAIISPMDRMSKLQ